MFFLYIFSIISIHYNLNKIGSSSLKLKNKDTIFINGTNKIIFLQTQVHYAFGYINIQINNITKQLYYNNYTKLMNLNLNLTLIDNFSTVFEINIWLLPLESNRDVSINIANQRGVNLDVNSSWSRSICLLFKFIKPILSNITHYSPDSYSIISNETNINGYSIINSNFTLVSFNSTFFYCFSGYNLNSIFFNPEIKFSDWRKPYSLFQKCDNELNCLKSSFYNDILYIDSSIDNKIWIILFSFIIIFTLIIFYLILNNNNNNNNYNYYYYYDHSTQSALLTN